MNLLPFDRVRALRGFYFLRLVTLSVFLLACVSIVFASIQFWVLNQASRAVQKEEKTLATISSSPKNAEQIEAGALSSTLASLDLATHPAASSAIKSITAVPHPGIRITGFVYTSPVGSTPPSLILSGVAATRESLRAYEDMLKKMPSITSVTIPVTAYAKESDIGFSATLTGTFLP